MVCAYPVVRIRIVRMVMIFAIGVHGVKLGIYRVRIVEEAQIVCARNVLMGVMYRAMNVGRVRTVLVGKNQLAIVYRDRIVHALHA